MTPFLNHYTQCLDLLPDERTKRLFKTALIGALERTLDNDAKAIRCIEIALGTAQDFLEETHA